VGSELSAILGTERFLNEIRVTANLQHPHVLGRFDSGGLQLHSSDVDFGRCSGPRWVNPLD
jgi:hypothetical protein